MKQASPEQLEALARLRAPEFAPALAYLSECLAEADRLNRSLDGPALHRSQGEAGCLATLLDKIHNARDTLARRALSARPRFSA